MKKLKVGAIRTLVHERLVSVEVSKGVHVLGYAFGSDFSANIIVCLRKLELEAAGLQCGGPCINRFYSSTKVTFLDKKDHPVEEEEEDEPDTVGDPDTNSGVDILDDQPAKKERKQRKVKSK